MLQNNYLNAKKKKYSVNGEFYHLYDDFSPTDLTAGNTNNTAVEPFGGVRTVVDTANRASISSGALTFSTSASSDPFVLYRKTPLYIGRILLFEFLPADTSVIAGFGSGTGISSTSNLFQINTGGVISGLLSGTAALSTYVGGSTYKCILINRVTGHYWFLWDSTNTKWKLIGLSTNFASANQVIYPNFGSRGVSALNVKRFCIPVKSYIPVPLISDGFSTTTSDGLGHQEGIAGGVGSGGNGISYIQNVGVWTVAGGVLTSTLSGGRSIITANCGKSDILISANITNTAGTTALIVRWVDENNFVMIRVTPTNNQLVKVVAGVSTTVQDSAVTYVAGAFMFVTCDGTKFRRYYNNALVGTEQTISDVVLQTPTYVGARFTDATNSIDNLVVHALGNGNEHSILNNY